MEKPLEKAPTRLQRMLIKLQPYDLQVTYRPGKELNIADTLSRAYLEEEPEQLLDSDLEMHQLSECLPISEEKLEAVKKATEADGELQMVIAVVKTVWPKQIRHVLSAIRKYWTFREELTLSEGLLFKNTHLVVLQSLQAEMLEWIHEAHLGVVQCKERARDVLF